MLRDKNIAEMQKFWVIPDKGSILEISHKGNCTQNKVSKL
jgi:hypothetical protein